MTRLNDRRCLPLWFAALTLLLVPGVTGCVPRRPTLVAASGSVTLDGKPVETGEIVFRAVDGAVASHAGPIVAGCYEVRMPPGAKRVEIIATRQSTKVMETPVDSGEPIPAEMYVPDRYNARSILTADVTAAGPNVFDFKLTHDSPRS